MPGLPEYCPEFEVPCPKGLEEQNDEICGKCFIQKRGSHFTAITYRIDGTEVKPNQIKEAFDAVANGIKTAPQDAKPVSPISQLILGHRVVQTANGWVLLEAGEKEKPRLTFSSTGSATAQRIADALKIEVEIVERQLAALELYREKTRPPDPTKPTPQEVTATKERIEKIKAGGYDRYLDFDYYGNVVKCHYDILVQDIVKEYDLITFTDIEDTWVYDADAKIYRDTGISTIKRFLRGALGEFFRKSFCEETIYQVKIATYVTREDVEPPGELLNLENGLLDIRTRELKPHDKKWFFTSCSPTTYDPDATRPNFDAMIDDFACIKIKSVQEFMGNILLDSPKHKKALLLSGPTDSGKTTFTNAIVNVIGKDSTCGIAIQHLDRRFQSRRLYKKKINLCGDLGAEAFTSITMFNRTVGGDPIEAEVKGANKTLNFIWGGKHWYDANDIPKAEGSADVDAFYNRLLMATFSKQIPKDKIDRSLPKRLEKETSGILNWMLDGLDRLEEQDEFSDTTSIEEIKDHYKRSSDTIYCFVKDRCSIIEGEFVVKIESCRKYITYCITKGYSSRGRSQFYEGLTRNLPAIKTDRRKVGTESPQVWVNLHIKEDVEPDAEPDKEPEKNTKDTRVTTLPAYTLPASQPLTPYPPYPVEPSKAVPSDRATLVTLVTLVPKPLEEAAPEPVDGTPAEEEKQLKGAAPSASPEKMDEPEPGHSRLVEDRELVKSIIEKYGAVSTDYIASALRFTEKRTLDLLGSMKRDGEIWCRPGDDLWRLGG